LGIFAVLGKMWGLVGEILANLGRMWGYVYLINIGYLERILG
jgi:hypothetical protein